RISAPERTRDGRARVRAEDSQTDPRVSEAVSGANFSRECRGLSLPPLALIPAPARQRECGIGYCSRECRGLSLPPLALIPVSARQSQSPPPSLRGVETSTQAHARVTGQVQVRPTGRR